MPEVEFDPNTTVPADDSFANLVKTDEGDSEEEKKAKLKQIVEELKKTTFGDVDVQDFNVFKKVGEVVKEGEYEFSVEQRFLKEATVVTGQTSSVGNRCEGGSLKLTLFKDSIKFSTFNQSAFSEYIIPTHEIVEGVEEGKEIAFIFNQAILYKIALNFKDAIITFKLNAKLKQLKIVSGETDLNLTTKEDTDFVEFHNNIKDLEYVCQVDPPILRRALQYNSLFTKKDDVQVRMSIVDIMSTGDAGISVSGTTQIVGIFESDFLEGCDLRVKYPALSVLEKVLGRFHVENTHLFMSETYFIIRDENFYFGFEKTDSRFPSVKELLKMEISDYCLIPRLEIIDSLSKLSVVSQDKDLLVNLMITGFGNDCKLTLETKDSSGRVSRDIIKCNRKNTEDSKESSFEDVNACINLSSFLKIIEHFNSQSILLKPLVNDGSAKSILLEDKNEEFKATTAISVLSEETMIKQKEVAENSKKKSTKSSGVKAQDH